MYTLKDRNLYLYKTIEKLEASQLVEGIVQIGSGVVGFSDEFSDIDLMVATSRMEDAESAKDVVSQVLSGFNPIYIKEKQFSKDIFLLIVFLDNKLEFNISIVPREMLSVKSPLWNVLVDKTGLVTEKMNHENEKFNIQQVKYEAGFDVPFEFVYSAMSLEKALKRHNLIYALNMLESMRNYTLYIQAMNEGKKLHQFKAYDTLNSSFVHDFLATYPSKLNIVDLKDSTKKLIGLFSEVSS